MKKTTKKRVTAKQKASREKFAKNAKRAGKLVSSGKAKSLKAAWKIIKK